MDWDIGDSMLRLNEDLFDDVIEIDVPDVEADITIDPDLSGPETPEDMGQATILLDAISCIAKNIDQYNVLKANLTDPEMIAVVDEMASNENINLGKLQTLLKKVSPNAENIMNGAVEAEQELSESLKGDTVVIVTTVDKNGKERLVVCKDMETAKKLHPRFKQRNVYPVQSIDSKNESLDEASHYNQGGRYYHYNDSKSITRDNPSSSVYYSVEGEYKVYRNFGTKEDAWNYYVNRMNKLPKVVYITERNKSDNFTPNWREGFKDGELVYWEADGEYGFADKKSNPEYWDKYSEWVNSPNYDPHKAFAKETSIPQYIPYEYKSKILGNKSFKEETIDEAENKWEDAEWRKYHGVDDDSFYDDNIETFGSPYSEEEPDDEFDDNYDSSIIMKLLSQEEVDNNI